MEALQDGFWKQADTVTSVFVHISVLLAALAGVIKFRLLNIFSRRYKSELECRHHLLSDGRIVFQADYTVSNTGERPIDFTGVSLCLCAAELRDGLLSPNPDRSFAKRVVEPSDTQKRPLFHIEAGERSTFTLRTILTSLDAVTFVLCQLTSAYKRPPAPYIGLYVRANGAESQQSEAAKAASADK